MATGKGLAVKVISDLCFGAVLENLITEALFCICFARLARSLVISWFRPTRGGGLCSTAGLCFDRFTAVRISVFGFSTFLWCVTCFWGGS